MSSNQPGLRGPERLAWKANPANPGLRGLERLAWKAKQSLERLAWKASE